MPGAIANAIFDGAGVRLRQAPFTPQRVLAELKAKATTSQRVQPFVVIRKFRISSSDLYAPRTRPPLDSGDFFNVTCDGVHRFGGSHQSLERKDSIRGIHTLSEARAT